MLLDTFSLDLTWGFLQSWNASLNRYNPFLSLLRSSNFTPKMQSVTMCRERKVFTGWWGNALLHSCTNQSTLSWISFQVLLLKFHLMTKCDKCPLVFWQRWTTAPISPKDKHVNYAYLWINSIVKIHLSFLLGFEYCHTFIIHTSPCLYLHSVLHDFPSTNSIYNPDIVLSHLTSSCPQSPVTWSP